MRTQTNIVGGHDAALPPKGASIVHGEPEAADALRLRLHDELGWVTHVPMHATHRD